MKQIKPTFYASMIEPRNASQLLSCMSHGISCVFAPQNQINEERPAVEQQVAHRISLPHGQQNHPQPHRLHQHHIEIVVCIYFVL